MAQIKSQKKRILTNEKAHMANASRKSAMRTAIKKVTKAVEAKNYEEASKLLLEALPLIDKAVGKGILKANTASRKKSSLTKLVNSIKA